MKYVVIGPFKPFRSGIARHTSAFADALETFGEVSRFSFSRLYPSILFPGKTDRDESPKEENVNYLIDSINPVTWIRVLRQVLDKRPDIVFIPAWTFFLAPCFWFLARGVRRTGTKVVAIVHNTADHEKNAFKNFLLDFQIREADGIITHNSPLADHCRRINPDALVSTSPHPAHAFPPSLQQLPRRGSLEILMFGLLRPYKGLDTLIDAFATVKDLDIHLSIVGEYWGDVNALQQRIQTLGLQGRIETVLRYVTDAEAAAYVARTDIVVLPYKSVSGSGVIPLAFQFGKPVIASDLPGFKELVLVEETGWTFPVNDSEALAHLLRQRLIRQDAVTLRPSVLQMRDAMDWGQFARTAVNTAGTNQLPPSPEEPPKISVILPVRNAEKYLSLAIQSILDQTFTDFELLVIDDGSTDNSARLIDHFAAMDTRIRVLRNSGARGLAAALNLGISAARGDYIARMDADDISLPTRLQQQVAFLDANADYSFVACAFHEIDSVGRALKQNFGSTTPQECDFTSIFKMPVIHPSMTIRASCLREHKISYDPTLEVAQDFEFIQRLLRTGPGCALPKLLFKYRVHDSALSETRKALQSENAALVGARGAAQRFPHIDVADLTELFSFLYAVERPSNLERALQTLQSIEAAYLSENTPSIQFKNRMRTLIARWLTRAALSLGLPSNPVLFARFLWLARSYLTHTPAEGFSYLSRRLVS